MERNAHRLTLHSPAEKSLPHCRLTNIDFGQFQDAFFNNNAFNHNHLRRLNHHATPSTSATSRKQNVPKP